MKIDTKNGSVFAEFIANNDLYNPTYFCEDYDKYLENTKFRDSLYEDFICRMEELGKPIQE